MHAVGGLSSQYNIIKEIKADYLTSNMKKFIKNIQVS